MDRQIQSLSNQIYNIKHKITDLEYYNLYQTLKLIAIGGTPVGDLIAVPTTISTTSSVSGVSSPYIEGNQGTISDSEGCYEGNCSCGLC